MAVSKFAEVHWPPSYRPNPGEPFAGNIGQEEEWGLASLRASSTSDRENPRALAPRSTEWSSPWLNNRREQRRAPLTPSGAEGAALNEAQTETQAYPTEVAAPDPNPGSRHGEPGRDFSREEAVAPTKSQARSLLEELTGLESRCADLAESLADVVQGLRAGNVHGGDLAPELTALQTAVGSLEKRTAELAVFLSVPADASTGRSMLGELRAILTAAVEAEEQRDFRALHEGAARELEDVLALEYPGNTGPNPLDECQSGGRRLLAEISGAQWPDQHPECLPLVERRHAYSRLLDLVRLREDLSDDDWQTAEEAVAASFGRRLAVAAVRGRLQAGKNGPPGTSLSQASPVTINKEASSCPHCGAQLEADARFCGDCGVKIE
jgi:plasmid stability protein